VTGVYGWTIERIAYRPLRNSTRLAPLISAIGMSLILQNYVQISQGPNQQGIPTLLSGVLRLRWAMGSCRSPGPKCLSSSRRWWGCCPDLDYSAYPARAHLPGDAAGSANGAILGINTDRVISLVLSSARRWPVWPACW
jgi:branched-chain amino acid transport system permease protein